MQLCFDCVKGATQQVGSLTLCDFLHKMIHLKIHSRNMTFNIKLSSNLSAVAQLFKHVNYVTIFVNYVIILCSALIQF